MMNDPNTQLKDLIQVYRGIVPPDLCDNTIDDAETRQWEKHQWSGGDSHSKELDIQNILPTNDVGLTRFINTALASYQNKHLFSVDADIGLQLAISNTTKVRFNRYGRGHTMLQHYDHIRTLFDGERRGIPILSIIINFNDDYEGGELFFWNDHIVPLGKGDIVIFPSIFLFPHGVKEVTRGFRYSGVSWAW